MVVIVFYFILELFKNAEKLSIFVSSSSSGQDVQIKQAGVYITNLNSDNTEGIMTFPIKMKNIVFALFRTYWNTDLPSSINNIATISNSISISTFLNFHSKG